MEGRGGAFCLVRGAPLASYELVAHFPSCSTVVVVVVAHVFEQRLTRLRNVLVRVCLRVDVCLSFALEQCRSRVRTCLLPCRHPHLITAPAVTRTALSHHANA